MRSFINQNSCYCLLGPQSKNITTTGNVFSWTVGKKQHFSLINDLTQEDLDYIKSISPSNFHYIDQNNFNLIKQNFKFTKTKETSIELEIKNLYFPGNNYKSIRNSLNKCKDKFIVQNTFNDIKDVKALVEEWGITSGDKYFRNFAGKNFYFYNNNHHLPCESIFVYDQSKLIAFGTASTPVNSYCSYVIGKALCLQYKGLSEFADVALYNHILNKYGPFTINMGQAMKGLLFYKNKFPNATEIPHYNGATI